MSISIAPESFGAPESRTLLDEFALEMRARYGTGDEPMHPVPEKDLVVFLVARVDGEAAGCALLRRHTPDLAEVKRMYIRSAFRRLGLGAALLGRLVDVARATGFTVLRLETGLAQPEAIAMYEAAGWRPISGFGQYAGSDTQRSYELRLDPSSQGVR
jgi:putative acetyltransferase